MTDALLFLKSSELEIFQIQVKADIVFIGNVV